METLEKVLLISFGWLLGLLSPAIVDTIRKRREAKEVKIAVWTELHELQYHLTNAVFLIENRYGQINRELIEWVQSIMKEYRGETPDNILQALERTSVITEEQFEDITRIMQSTTTDRGLALKKQAYLYLKRKLEFWHGSMRACVVSFLK